MLLRLLSLQRFALPMTTSKYDVIDFRQEDARVYLRWCRWIQEQQLEYVTYIICVLAWPTHDEHHAYVVGKTSLSVERC